MKFVLYLDYKADYKPMYQEYKPMQAATLEEAIAEADAAWNENIYLARIMRKDGKIEKLDGHSAEKYEAILCRRSYGWHRNTKENSENYHSVRKIWLNRDRKNYWFGLEA